MFSTYKKKALSTNDKAFFLEPRDANGEQLWIGDAESEPEWKGTAQRIPEKTGAFAEQTAGE